MPQASARNSGFSLIEMLAALAIVALGASAVLLAAPPQPADPMRLGAHQTEAFVASLRLSAIMSGETQAAQLDQGRWSVRAWSNGAWGEASAKPLILPADVSLASSRRADTGADIIASPTGIVEARALTLSRGTEQRTLRFASNGALVDAEAPR